jgi:hypothetical protein
MSIQITIDLRDAVFSALRSCPENLVNKMRMAAAAKWYETGLVTRSKAGALARVSPELFLEALSGFRVFPFQKAVDEPLEVLSCKQKTWRNRCRRKSIDTSSRLIN